MNAHRKVSTLAITMMLVLAGLTGAAGTVVAQSAGNAGNTGTGDTVSAAGNVAVTVEQVGNASGAVVTVTDGDVPVENATVDVTSDTTYAGTGTYQTGAEGTVSLPAPAETTTVTVTATSGNHSATTTAELEALTFESFGQRVSYFVHGLLDGQRTEGGIGQFVSEFVKTHNPSNDNKPDHAGKPDKAGKPDHAGQNGEKDKAGKPENAGEKGNEDKQTGKPDHANGKDKAKDDESEEEQTDDAQADESDSDRRPDRGNGNGNEKGPKALAAPLTN
ncbi:hypothetical protein [Halogranum rubrum]|uniref:Uncharacterized protein n=1 Tax=Halogranum salarium B-1 TaxID=1210908 RepID=J3A354_9EURY|nr:hypothetical protein [Halogranum salarium]EJN59773.1 hypothetical protein HSB1_19310 [Halogranum salarium B-1]